MEASRAIVTKRDTRESQQRLPLDEIVRWERW